MRRIVKGSMMIFGVLVFMFGMVTPFYAQGEMKPVTKGKPTPMAPLVNKLPDLVPVGNPAAPSSFCVWDNQGRLVIKIKNGALTYLK